MKACVWCNCIHPPEQGDDPCGGKEIAKLKVEVERLKCAVQEIAAINHGFANDVMRLIKERDEARKRVKELKVLLAVRDATRRLQCTGRSRELGTS